MKRFLQDMEDVGEVLRDVSELSHEDLKKQNRNLQKFLVKVIDLLKEKSDRCSTQEKHVEALKLQVCVLLSFIICSYHIIYFIIFFIIVMLMHTIMSFCVLFSVKLS